MSRTDVPRLVPGPTMAEVAAEYDHRRAELKEAIAAERRAVVVRQHPPGRTPEAQADIAAARAPIEDDIAVTQDLDAALSNAALADTPAVREMGRADPFNVQQDAMQRAAAVRKLMDRQPYPALDPANLPPGAVLLTGNEAAHYRRLQDAARASQAAQNALATAGAELRDAFGALCKAIADGKVES